MQTWVLMMALLVYGILASTIPTYNQQAMEGVSASDPAALTPGSNPVSVFSRSVYTGPSPLEKRVIISQFINQPFVRTPFSDPTYAWMLRLELVHALEPIQMAATTLIPFYDHMMEQLAQQWSQATVSRSMPWQLGDVMLEMRSRDHESPIPLFMVFDLLGVLRGFAQRNMVGTFEGEVVSVMTGWSIWIRLRIAGVAQPYWGRGH